MEKRSTSGAGRSTTATNQSHATRRNTARKSMEAGKGLGKSTASRTARKSSSTSTKACK